MNSSLEMTSKCGDYKELKVSFPFRQFQISGCSMNAQKSHYRNCGKGESFSAFVRRAILPLMPKSRTMLRATRMHRVGGSSLTFTHVRMQSLLRAEPEEKYVQVHEGTVWRLWRWTLPFEFKWISNVVDQISSKVSLFAVNFNSCWKSFLLRHSILNHWSERRDACFPSAKGWIKYIKFEEILRWSGNAK